LNFKRPTVFFSLSCAAGMSDLDALDPTLERSFRGHKGAVTSVAWNSNLKQLVRPSKAGGGLWVHGPGSHCLCCGGGAQVSGGEDDMVMVWNFKPQLRAFRFIGHKVCGGCKRRCRLTPLPLMGHRVLCTA
jgi:hypothetical protein